MENVTETGKKRKLGSEESEHLFQLKTRRLAVVTPENSASSVNCEYSTCERVISSDNVVISEVCFSNRSSELEKIQKENTDEQTGESLEYCRERTETSPLMEVQADSGELEKMPSEDELEEFFAAAEKNLQKRFIDKYNFDIVKDEPLEGRYEWVHIQPKPS